MKGRGVGKALQKSGSDTRWFWMVRHNVHIHTDALDAMKKIQPD
jgi:hypothetical protein